MSRAELRDITSHMCTPSKKKRRRTLISAGHKIKEREKKGSQGSGERTEQSGHRGGWTNGWNTDGVRTYTMLALIRNPPPPSGRAVVKRKCCSDLFTERESDGQGCSGAGARAQNLRKMEGKEREPRRGLNRRII